VSVDGRCWIVKLALNEATPTMQGRGCFRSAWLNLQALSFPESAPEAAWGDTFSLAIPRSAASAVISFRLFKKQEEVR